MKKFVTVPPQQRGEVFFSMSLYSSRSGSFHISQYSILNWFLYSMLRVVLVLR